MKKIVAVLLLIGVVFSVSACNSTKNEVNSLIELKKEESLYIGDRRIFKNVETEVTEDVYLTCTAYVVYRLRRSLTEPTDKSSFFYDGYYYYWEEGQNHKQVKVGTKTVKTSYTYSYLPLNEYHTNIMVQIKTEIKNSYDYEPKVIEVPYDYDFDLDGFFWNISALQERCPELYQQLGTIGMKKYFADTGVENRVDVSTQTFFDTYFYVE